MAIILGIDPGSRVTGYGVIRQQGRQLIYLGSGCIRTQVPDLPSRLKRMRESVKSSLNFHPMYFLLNKSLWQKMQTRH